METPKLRNAVAACKCGPSHQTVQVSVLHPFLGGGVGRYRTFGESEIWLIRPYSVSNGHGDILWTVWTCFVPRTIAPSPQLLSQAWHGQRDGATKLTSSAHRHHLPSLNARRTSLHSGASCHIFQPTCGNP